MLASVMLRRCRQWNSDRLRPFGTNAETKTHDWDAALHRLLSHWQHVGHQPSVEAVEDAISYLDDLRRCVADADGKN